MYSRPFRTLIIPGDALWNPRRSRSCPSPPCTVPCSPLPEPWSVPPFPYPALWPVSWLCPRTGNLWWERWSWGSPGPPTNCTEPAENTGAHAEGSHYTDIKDANGNKITEWVSTTNGHVIRILSNGTYKLEEVAAPQGYKLNKEAVTFTINDSNKDVKVTFENEAKEVVVNILKVDASTGEALEGAVLVLTKPNGEQIKIVTTKEAYVITGLEDGTYKLHEEVAPNGYIKSDKVITFTIDDENLSHQITFENAPEVEVPDTASSSIIFSLIGMVIISLGLGFIYKNGQKA